MMASSNLTTTEPTTEAPDPPATAVGPPRCLDLFCGCGGFAEGFAQAGAKISVSNDIWPDAVGSHRLNHASTTHVTGDIREDAVRDAVIAAVIAAGGGVDVIIGGPPCQAYSMAGKRNPEDARGQLFENYVAIASVLRPRVVVMENVKGILSMRHLRVDADPDLRRAYLAATSSHRRSKRFLPILEKVVDKVSQRFVAAGYRVAHRTLVACDYGSPQRRERVIFIATRDDIGVDPATLFPPLTHGEGRANPHLTVRDAIDDLKDVPDDAAWHHVRMRHGPAFLEKIRNTPIGKSATARYSDAFYRCPPDLPSRTVKHNNGGVFLHYDRDRVMTPRELARLQGFRDTYRFHGTKSSVLKQLGNAVPVDLSRAIAAAVLATATPPLKARV